MPCCHKEKEHIAFHKHIEFHKQNNAERRSTRREAGSSWQQFGPGTATRINVTDQDWVAIVRQFASNPFAPKTGNVLKIKLAYMNSLLNAYEHLGIQEALDKTRHSPPLTGHGIQIMNGYKKASKNHFNGDMSLKIERSRR